MPEITVELFLDSSREYVQHYRNLIKSDRAFFDRLFTFLSQQDVQDLMTSPEAEVALPSRGEVMFLCPLKPLLPRLESKEWYLSHLSGLSIEAVHRINQATGAVVKFLMGFYGHEVVLRSLDETKADDHPLSGRFVWSMKSAAVYERSRYGEVQG